MLEYGLLKRLPREVFIRERIRGAMTVRDETERHYRIYELPGVLDTTDPSGNLWVCKASFLNLHGIYSYQFRSYLNGLDSIGYLRDLRLGNKGRPVTEMAVKYAHVFFKELQNICEPYATRFVREITGLQLRNEEVGVLLLPTYFSKRNCYIRYCYGLGFKTRASAKGNFGSKKLFIKRMDENTDDFVDFADGEDSDDQFDRMYSWSSFLNFWNKNYPLIRIKPKSEDMCGECHIYMNRVKYSRNKRLNERLRLDMQMRTTPLIPEMNESCSDHSEDESENSDSEIQKTVEDVDDGYFIEGGKDLINPDESGDEESIIIEAAQHVTRAHSQRLYAIELQEESRLDAINEVAHEDRRYTFIGDFAQNIYLPFFGSNQPGETYYFSPKMIYQFGVVDVSDVIAKMKTYVYPEEDGKKEETMLLPY